MGGHFNPRSPCGERPVTYCQYGDKRQFQSTLPVWGATPSKTASLTASRFQSTLPVWGATSWFYDGEKTADISIHAPRVGSDFMEAYTSASLCLFQSTLPVWGATSSAISLPTIFIFQSTLPVWGATGRRHHQQRSGPISIHAPRVGSDSGHHGSGAGRRNFNPRSPCGERRGNQRPRVRGGDFNPRSPCGERPAWARSLSGRPVFQSTLPVWGATSPCHVLGLSALISIHAPRVGSDGHGEEIELD